MLALLTAEDAGISKHSVRQFSSIGGSGVLLFFRGDESWVRARLAANVLTTL